MEKRNCRAAHTTVSYICEMVSTNFKHINANIIVSFLSGTNWIYPVPIGVGSSCGRQVHQNENGLCAMPETDCAFGFVPNVQLVVYHKLFSHPDLS